MRSFRSVVLLALSALPLLAVSPNLVISHVYGGGSNSGATWQNDFVVIFNRGNASVSLTGMSIQYASAAGTGSFSANPVTALSGNLAAGQYYLVQLAGAATSPVGAALPTPDATGTANLSGTAGKVILANTTTGLACNGGSTPCSSAQLAQIVDLVGYGSANFFEGAATPAPSNTSWIARKNGGCTETDNNSADFAVATTGSIPNTATALSPCGATTPVLSINDVSQVEGDAGTTNFVFTVALSSPAGAGGVTFDIATADGTATVLNSDYVANSLVGQTIAAGNSSTTFTVVVNGDVVVEPNETFFVNVTNVTGATVGDAQGQGTIVNDDFILTKISTIQGSGNTSPLVGTAVTTRGIVTAVASNSFYIQDPAPDADPNTSEGIVVFTNAAPPAAAAVGNLVQVTGSVTEFIPSADPNSPSITEIIPTLTTVVSTGNALPAPVVISSLTAAGGTSQLEKYEGMLVKVNSLTVVAPTDGTVNEPNATSSSTGVFYGVLTGTATPFREAGIEVFDPKPLCAAGASCAIPTFDANPERLRVNSRGITGVSAVEVGTGNVLTNLTGVLSYGFRAYTILPTVAPSVGGTAVIATPVPASGAGSVTVAAMNVERLFDDAAPGDVVMTTAALSKRLGKISNTIVNILRTPDVVALEEVENLNTLQLLANRVNTDAPAAGYVAYLFEGNDPGGIDVGFLVKNTVQVGDIVQLGLNTTYTNPCTGAQDLLNDRPPLRLHGSAVKSGQTLNFTVFVNHLRSLNGIADATVCNAGGVTNGARVRAKRAAQSNFLAGEIQNELNANPAAKIIAVGDFNAFEVNDGYVDVLAGITGTPAPATQVVNATLDPSYANLTNMLTLLPGTQRYSYVFDGNHQTLDHVLLNPAALAQVVGGGYGRVNADFSESLRNDGNRPERYSDHDPAIVFLTTASNVTANVTVVRSGLLYNRTALTATSNLTITNNSAAPIAGPIQVAINGLPSGVTITNASANQGAAYIYNLAGPLNPGQSTTVTLNFSMSVLQAISYAVNVFSGTL